MPTETIQSAISVVKNKIKNRENLFNLDIQTSLSDSNCSIANNKFLPRLILSKCCSANEYDAGQYIWYHLLTYKNDCVYDSTTGIASVQFCVNYYTDSTQEQSALSAADSLISTLGLSVQANDTEPQIALKVKALYDWITQNCTYSKIADRDVSIYHPDGTHTDNNPVVRNAMWDCLVSDPNSVKKKAACQSFSNAMYYILNKAGIDTAIVQGYEVDWRNRLFPHVWNLCKIGDVWYNTDVTAAVHCADGTQGYADCDIYSWLLCGSSDFGAGPNRYIRFPAFYSGRFNSDHVVAGDRYYA